MTSTAPLPVCKAILLCRQVRVGESGELSLIDLVGNFFLDELLVAPPTELFCQITDAVGHYSVVVEVHDVEAREVVGRSEPTEFEAVDPLMCLDVIMSMSAMRFQRIGLHDIVVFANGEEIDRRQFGVAFREGVEHAVSH